MRQICQISPVLALLLSSCAIFSPPEHSDLNAALPKRFSLYTDETPDTTNRWWESFESEELNALIEEALTNSPTIQQAWARLAQADAIATQAGASRLPSANYTANASTSRQQTSTGLYSGSDSFNSFNLGANATYELDLWGRVKSKAEAAALDREASREQVDTAMITLSSQVALRWSAILSQRLKLEVLDRQLEANKSSLELTELRFRKSLSSALDVYQQRQVVSATASAIPLAQLNEELLNNELAALLGRTDLHSLDITESELPAVGDLPAIGIPADILANRPDVRQAGLSLQSADWSVSAARADRLPAIRLTASATYGGSRIDIGNVFDDWIANLAASVTGPIFEGGRRKAEVERTRAIVDERLAVYRATVINAVKEVENALASEQKQHNYIELLDQQLESAQLSYNEAINRYRNGLIDYTTVLIQLNTLQAIERNRVAAQYDLLQYRINLYRALGGSWPSEFTSN